MQVLMPCWSPDSKRIAFQAVTPGNPSRIYVISAEGGTPEPVWKEQHNQNRADWSPDGSYRVQLFPWSETANGIRL